MEKKQRRPTAWYKRSTGVVAWLIYFVVRMVFAVMQVLPLEWTLRGARILAGGWRLILPKHFNRAIEHLTRALGNQCGRGEIERMAQACLENVTMFAAEAVCLPRLVNRFTWGRYIEVVNFTGMIRVILEDRGAIFVTAHYSSFELPAQLLACLGFDVCAVMRPLDNEYLNRFIVNSRKTHGLTLLDKKGAMSQAEEMLRRGSLLALVGDQDAGRKGLFVDFFGQPASTYKSIGLLAMSTRCPIVVGYARRHSRMARYEVGIGSIIEPHEWEAQVDPLRWITQTYTSAIEAIIRHEPEQYLWIHRRWKSVPKVRKSVGVENADENLRAD